MLAHYGHFGIIQINVYPRPQETKVKNLGRETGLMWQALILSIKGKTFFVFVSGP